MSYYSDHRIHAQGADFPVFETRNARDDVHPAENMDGIATDAPEMEDAWRKSPPVKRSKATRAVEAAGAIVIGLIVLAGLGLAVEALISP